MVDSWVGADLVAARAQGRVVAGHLEVRRGLLSGIGIVPVAEAARFHPDPPETVDLAMGIVVHLLVLEVATVAELVHVRVGPAPKEVRVGGVGLPWETSSWQVAQMSFPWFSGYPR